MARLFVAGVTHRYFQLKVNLTPGAVGRLLMRIFLTQSDVSPTQMVNASRFNVPVVADISVMYLPVNK
jgi:hypothetical protein